MAIKLDERLTHQRRSRAPGNPTKADLLVGFWRSYVLLGFSILAAESVAVAVYLFETPDGPHRRLLVTVAFASAGGAVVGLAMARWVAGSTWRSSFSLVWAVETVLITAICAHLDGGLESPLLLLVVIPVMYTAMALSARSVAIVSGTALVAFSAIGLADHDTRAHPFSLTMLCGLVLGVIALAVVSAIHRTRLESREAALLEVLRRHSEIDELTGCWNYRIFHERLRDEVDRALAANRPLSMLVWDVDLLRSFNDTYGQAAGDAALAGIGSTLRSVVRSRDLVARIGGDEFAVLMPGADGDEAETVARRIVAALRATKPAAVTMSAGVAALDPHDPTPVRLLRDADAALYDAKALGRNSVVSVAPSPGPVEPRGVDLAKPVDAGADSRRMMAVVRKARRESTESRTILDTLLEDSPIGVAFIDRDLRVALANPVMARLFGGIPTEFVGRPLADLIPHLWARFDPLCHLVLDERTPALNVEVREPARSLASRGLSRDWLANLYPVEVDDEVIGIGAIVVDISDRKRLEQAGVALTDAVVSALAATAEARDPYTAGHQRRVSELTIAIATDLGYDHDTVRGIGLAAAIHDIGKVAVPAELLARPGVLNTAEMELIRTHSTAGYTILHDIAFPWPVAAMVRQHHERLDGSGYPDGLHGEQILVGARIIAVADVIEAMAARRPYRSALGLDRALATIDEGRGTLFDPDPVDACLRLFRNNLLSPTLMRVLRGEGESRGSATSRQIGGEP